MPPSSICGMLPSADRLYKGLSADFFALGVSKTPLIGRRGCLLHTLDLKSFAGAFDSGVFTTLFFVRKLPKTGVPADDLRHGKRRDQDHRDQGFSVTSIEISSTPVSTLRNDSPCSASAASPSMTMWTPTAARAMTSCRSKICSTSGLYGSTANPGHSGTPAGIVNTMTCRGIPRNHLLPL